jgi:uncharacterized Zn finger protein
VSRRDGWDWESYDAPPKRPPPKRGIKVKKAGATWWGRRWIEALEAMSSGYSGRLGRGKTYARAGRAHDLAIGGGKVTAKVTGSREPYDVRIELAAFRDSVWRRAIAAMAAKAQFAAELLAGRMPDEIDDAFKQAGKSLFPIKASDLRTNCNCPDWANPCKHVAAVHFVLGEAFDRDPFLLFELRGRSREQVLETLRAVRANAAEGSNAVAAITSAGARPASEEDPRPKRRSRTSAAGAPVESSFEIDVATVSLGRLKAADYDAPPEPLPSLRFDFNAPPVSGALLRQLGAPSGWSGALTPADRLGPMVRAAADAARRLALGSSERGETEADTTPTP